MSKLIRIAKGLEKQEIGILKSPLTNTFVTSAKASADLLLDHGFPDSEPFPADRGPPGPEDRVFPIPPSVHWLSPDMMVAAFKKFKNFKAPGPDTI